MSYSQDPAKFEPWQQYLTDYLNEMSLPPTLRRRDFLLSATACYLPVLRLSQASSTSSRTSSSSQSFYKVARGTFGIMESSTLSSTIDETNQHVATKTRC